MKTNDITIAAFPKSGITWLAFLLATARAQANGLAIRPTFYNIDWLVIDSHKMEGCEYAHIWSDGMGDFIKTHSLWKNVPNVIYLLRNPYDVLKSYYHFENRLGNQQSIKEFLKDKIPQWCTHVSSWLIQNRSPSQSIHLIEYEAIHSETLSALFRQLGFEWDVAAALKRSDQERMKANEERFAAHNPVYRPYELQFVRPGSVREVAGFEEYREIIKERCGETYCQVSRLGI